MFIISVLAHSNGLIALNKHDLMVTSNIDTSDIHGFHTVHIRTERLICLTFLLPAIKIPVAQFPPLDLWVQRPGLLYGFVQPVEAGVGGGVLKRFTAPSD